MKAGFYQSGRGSFQTYLEGVGQPSHYKEVCVQNCAHCAASDYTCVQRLTHKLRDGQMDGLKDGPIKTNRQTSIMACVSPSFALSSKSTMGGREFPSL